MAAYRAAAGTLRCFKCQSQAVKPLASCATSTTRGALFKGRLRPGKIQQRVFSSVFFPHQDHAPKSLHTPGNNSQELHGKDEGEVADIAQAQTVSTPWYLDLQESANEASNPFAARQRMPDLPSNAPPILRPLLEHISIDLGLDYLSILDLRSLDPPPALGAGLIMVFGSARSEKHLNVSADRLCRWLRSTYKLSPYADGLLGRNELKLKLRRKARRSRMLGAAGAAETSNSDDGITTGWICVNVGEVDSNPSLELNQHGSETQGFVGFGKRTDAARVVVQVMTEEKRNEIDLETLWQGILEREGRKKEGERRAWERLDQVEDASRPLSKPNMSNMPGSRIHEKFLKPSDFSPFVSGQIKGYHTSVASQNTKHSNIQYDNLEILNEDELEPHLLPSTYIHHHLPSAGHYPIPKDHHPATNSDVLAPTGSFDNVTAGLTLRTQLEYLRKLKPSVARKQLGLGERDKTSTPFLFSFHNAFPVFPDIEHWLCAVELQCYALTHAQPGYTRLYLLQMLRDMQASGIWIAQPIFILALEAILLTDHEVDHKSIICESPEVNRFNAFRRSLGFAFEVIERMEAHGYDICNKAVLLLLLEGIMAYPRNTSSQATLSATCNNGDTSLLVDHNVDKLQYKFRRALNELYTPLDHSDDPIYLALMRACIITGHWDGLWDSWRNLPRMLKRRGPQMYFTVFSEVAKTCHQAQCQRVLSECVPELERESPPVPIEGELARAILECMVIAKIDANVMPWRQLVQNCKDGLGL